MYSLVPRTQAATVGFSRTGNISACVGAPHSQPAAPCTPSPAGGVPQIPGLQDPEPGPAATPQQCLTPGCCLWKAAAAMARAEHGA